MKVNSAGILPYRYVSNKLEVMLAHPGGPFWAKKDEASWSIPKGLSEEGESLLDAAKREFYEETGFKVDCDLIELGSVAQSSKIITAFAANIDIDVDKVTSNTFEMEWPPKSGQMQEFPENDKAEWFSVEKARNKIFKGQVEFLSRLTKQLNYTEKSDESECEEQLSLI